MEPRYRLRELGIHIGTYDTGRWNSITDVEGVMVGHQTLIQDVDERTSVRTGVTAILPHPGNLFQEKVLPKTRLPPSRMRRRGWWKKAVSGQVQACPALATREGSGRVPASLRLEPARIQWEHWCSAILAGRRICSCREKPVAP